MRYLKATLVALLGALLVAVAVTTIEGVIAARRLSSTMANCAQSACMGAARFNGGGVLISCALVFVAALTWLLRGRRRLPGL